MRGIATIIGLLVVVAAPVALLVRVLRPEPLDAQHLRVHFESMRYERAGLVFTYLLENRTRRAARLLPGRARIRVMQPGDEPVVGYPVMKLPLEIEAHGSRRVEVRLELPIPREDSPQQTAEQTARVLQHALPNTAVIDSPLAPLPMTKLPPPASAPSRTPAPETLLANALLSLQGFELIDEARDIRIVFPRGW